MHENSQYSFIDTPGLNDAKGDEKNINEIKTGLSDYPKFRCILILLKFQDIRLKDTDIKSLKIFMQCFPSKKFWEHVFIVRTHADVISKKFKKEKKKLEEKLFKVQIDEFYVDNDNEDENNYSNNEEEFDKIFKKIKNTPPMFKKVSKIEYDQIETAGHTFPVKQTWRKIKYLDYDNNEISSNPYISFESEETNYPILERRKRKTVVDTESDCGDVKIKYDYYETCIYNVDGRKVEGKECYKGSGWE